MPVDMIAQPLGIMSLDAWLRRHGYEDIHLFDMRLKKESPRAFVPRLLAGRPDVVGLSSMTIEKDCVHHLAALIKQRAPEVIVVVGGPYGTSSATTIAKDQNVDYVVVGEGEHSFTQLLDTLRDGGDPALVHGLVLRRGGQIIETPSRATIEDLDELPLPSWDRIDMAAYQQVFQDDNLTGQPWAVVQTSRGCPFRCTYCHNVFGKRFRAQSAQRVLAELEVLVERYGIRELHIYDDIFNFHKQRLIEICDGIAERGWNIHIQFPNGLRTDLLNRDVLEALRRAGTFRVSIAIESVTPRIQKQVKKYLNIKRVERNIAIADELGMMMHGFFMLGFPGETRQEILDTIEYACRSRLHTAAFFLVTPFEGSELSDDYVQPAEALHGDSFNYYDNPHSMAEVSARELRWLQRYAYFRFYGNPRRVIRFVHKLPVKRRLLRYSLLFAQIVSGRLAVHGANEDSFKYKGMAPQPGAPATALPDSILFGNAIPAPAKVRRHSLPVLNG